jgi:hypothetical protein
LPGETEQNEKNTCQDSVPAEIRTGRLPSTNQKHYRLAAIIIIIIIIISSVVYLADVPFILKNFTDPKWKYAEDAVQRMLRQ